MSLFAVLRRIWDSALSESFDVNAIDWSKLAEPQADQYDTDVILRLASSTTSVGRPQRYVRTPVGIEWRTIVDGVGWYGCRTMSLLLLSRVSESTGSALCP